MDRGATGCVELVKSRLEQQATIKTFAA